MKQIIEYKGNKYVVVEKISNYVLCNRLWQNKNDGYEWHTRAIKGIGLYKFKVIPTNNGIEYELVEDEYKALTKTIYDLINYLKDLSSKCDEEEYIEVQLPLKTYKEYGDKIKKLSNCETQVIWGTKRFENKAYIQKINLAGNVVSYAICEVE